MSIGFAEKPKLTPFNYICIGVLIAGFAIVTNVILVKATNEYDFVDVVVEEKSLYYNKFGELTYHVQCDDGIKYVISEADFDVMQEGEKYHICRYYSYSGFWIWTEKQYCIKSILDEDIEIQLEK